MEATMITSDQFESLERDMSYDEACEVLGQQGTLISSEVAQIEPGIRVDSLVSEIFEWQDADIIVRLLFKRGRLNDMSQNGLQLSQ